MRQLILERLAAGFVAALFGALIACLVMAYGAGVNPNVALTAAGAAAVLGLILGPRFAAALFAAFFSGI